MPIAIANKSDNLIFMKEMTVTEVARNFSAVISAVEAGEEILVRRGKSEVARILPPEKPNGAALIEALEKLQANRPPYDPAVGDVWDEIEEFSRSNLELLKERDPWNE
jgi:antitoxin (DNA-binding transcriptional repressor) of toxin-antitoxin stability system